MIRPYLATTYNDDFSLMGIIFTCGYLPNEKCFQIALTLGGLTLAIGIGKEQEE